MPKSITRAALGALAGLFALGLTSAQAADMATPAEAKTMAEKAMDAVESMGPEAAFEAFADPDGPYQEKDLYVFCMDMEGTMVSHAKKPGLVGKNLKDFNKYGDYLFQDMIEVAQASGEGWVTYRWPYPGTDEIREKDSWIAAHDGEFFCGVGAYK